MSLAKILFTNRFWHHKYAVTQPLNARFEGDKLAFIQVGPLGAQIGAVQISKGIPRFAFRDSIQGHVSAVDVVKRLKKSFGSAFGGKIPVIAGISHEMDWVFRPGLDFRNHSDFVFSVRADPVRTMIKAGADSTYTGLYQSDGANGLALGVKTSELAGFEQILIDHGFDPVRRCVPALSVLNLLLADPRVTSGEYLPLVCDQGHAFVVAQTAGRWATFEGRRFSGGEGNPQMLIELLDYIPAVTAMPAKILLASSTFNGDIPPAQILRTADRTAEEYAIGTINADHLFAYATAIL